MAPADDNRALVPSTERPTFTAEDLALVDPGGVDDGALAAARAAVATGAFTVEQAAKNWGLSDAEKAALAKPLPRTRTPTALAAIEKELVEIAEYRRNQKIKYYRDAAVQAREAELLAKRERLRALPAAARDDAAADALPPALQERWGRQPGGVDGALDAIRRRMTMAFDGDDAEDLKLAFDTEELDADIQVEIADGLAQDGGRWPAATAEDVRKFETTDHGAALLGQWGTKAPALLGAAMWEAQHIWGQLTETSRIKLSRWCDSRPAAQREQIIRVLAARASRRTAVRAAGR